MPRNAIAWHSTAIEKALDNISQVFAGFVIEFHADEANLIWTPATAIPPSPTAAAHRFTEPERTSPAAKIPGKLVSSGPG